MPAWTHYCSLGPGNGELASGTASARIKVDLDESGLYPQGLPVLTIGVEGSTFHMSLMLQPKNMRDLARTLRDAADKYEELDANYDKAREAEGTDG